MKIRNHFRGFKTVEHAKCLKSDIWTCVGHAVLFSEDHYMQSLIFVMARISRCRSQITTAKLCLGRI